MTFKLSATYVCVYSCLIITFNKFLEPFLNLTKPQLKCRNILKNSYIDYLSGCGRYVV